MLIMVTYWLNRAADLIRYQLLILPTHAQFGGLAWCSDEAFRRDAAARQVTNWSAMHVELYNFHTSAATRLLYLNLRWVGIPRKHRCFFWYDHLPSWNMRRCVASRAVCRYLHLCDLPRCRGNHRRIHCPNQTSGAVASVFPQSSSLPVQPNITMLQRPGARYSLPSHKDIYCVP